MVYQPVSRTDIIQSLVHMRDLFRETRPRNESESRASELREVVTRDFLSNLTRAQEHPRLRTLLGLGDLYSLTLDGAHKLFGYDLDSLREFDLQFNGTRTHIVESYSFARDKPIDLPLLLGPDQRFEENTLLKNLVQGWQSNVPIRALDDRDWRHGRLFYVHVGTEDSLGSTIPPGSTASVELVSDEEVRQPHPRNIYLLQFGNGYRCSHCVVTKGKLRLFSPDLTYLGREEFAYPGQVRIVGKIRMFAVGLPVPEYPNRKVLPPCNPCAELILPWEHSTRARLLATKHKRFRRTTNDDVVIQRTLGTHLHSRLSARSQRRYRSGTTFEPHANVLMHLSVSHVARYTDALRVGGSWLSDRGKFSLQTLLSATSLDELRGRASHAVQPEPHHDWAIRRQEYGEWPTLLSIKFPQLSRWDDRIVRLAEKVEMSGVEPALEKGSWLLLEPTGSIPDVDRERTRVGWSRPLYAIRRKDEVVCGHLEREGTRLILVARASRDQVSSCPVSDLSTLSHVKGVAVPML